MGDYVSKSNKDSVPLLTKINELEEASIRYEDKDNLLDLTYLKILLAPGSSLGGARPKASLIDNYNNLYSAKFPSINDEIDVGGWEYVTYKLATLCHLKMSESTIYEFSKYGHTFVTKRFDRNGLKRIHFCSAMTLLNKNDHENIRSSYLEIVNFIKEYGNNVNDDLRELYCRIVFYISVSNTDDHLRNHGFLYNHDGWSLSPMYDVNPNIYGGSLSLNIDESSGLLDFNLIYGVHDYFNINDVEAKEIIKEITHIVSSSWYYFAKETIKNISEIKYMSKAFVEKEININ